MAKENEGAAQAVVEHSNIYVALAAFQAENPEITKTKSFGKPGDSMHFKYADLDEFLKVVRPLTSKHGIAITWEGTKDGLVCALYHATYKVVEDKVGEILDGNHAGENEVGLTNRTFANREEGVIRSMPIKVSREGKMQTIGSDSTYARRYTLSEVLGVASDEDNDAEMEKESGKNAQSAMYTRARKGIDDASTSADTEKAVKVLKADLALIEKGKAPSLGLKKEQYVELIQVAEKKIADLDAGQGQ